MASSDSEPLSEHRTSEIGFSPPPSTTSGPSRRARNDSSTIHPNAPPREAYATPSDSLNEGRLGVQSDDIQPLTSDPPQSSPPVPDEDVTNNGKLYTDAEFEKMYTRMKKNGGSLHKFLRTAMWRKSRHYGVVGILTSLLKEEDNPWICERNYEFFEELLDIHQWQPVKARARRELLQFGGAVVQPFKEPNLMDESMNLTQELEFLNKEGQCRQQAPMLFDILNHCTAPLRADQNRQDPPWPAPIMVVAQLAYLTAPRKFNRLAISLGMVLSYHHLSKRGLDTLNALGIAASYRSVNTQTKKIQETHKKTLKLIPKRMLNRAIVWDNLYRVDKVAETRAGDEKEQMSVTTGLIKLCRSISPNGLRQSLLNWSCSLKEKDMLPTQPNAILARKELTQELWLFYIFDAIQTCFPHVLPTCSTNDRSRTKITFPSSLPDHGRPENHSADWCIPLGPLMHDESTNAGTLNIFDDIYNEQFGLDEKKKQDMEQFEDGLFLHFGDALTTMRMWTAKADKSADDSAYGGGRWILPVFGLWHLKYRYAKMIIAEHGGGQDDDLSCLYQVWHSMYTDRHCDHNIFQVIDNLILQSFKSRILALFIRYCYEHQDTTQMNFQHDTATPPEYVQVDNWWKSQHTNTLNSVVHWIYNELDPRKNTSRTDPQNTSEIDEEWTNHFNFVQNVFPYVLLSDAIQVCDFGLVRFAMQLTLLMFSANSSAWTYQRELCYYNWLINSDAAKEELQKAVIRESMINRQGNANSYYPMDLANELLNLFVTKAKTLRRTSSLTVYTLLDRYIRTAPFLENLADALDKVVEIRRTTYHTKKDVDVHLWLMAGNLWAHDYAGNSSITYTPGRGTRGLTNYWYSQGQLNLHTVITKFNNVRSTALVGGDLESVEDGEYQVQNANTIRTNLQAMEQQLQILSLENETRHRMEHSQSILPSTSGFEVLGGSQIRDSPRQTTNSIFPEVQPVYNTNDAPDSFSEDLDSDPELAEMLQLLDTSLEEFEMIEQDRHPQYEDSEEDDDTQRLPKE